MKADPQAQRRLLDLQAIDTALAQLAHRRRTLPEHAELDALARELSALEDERVRAQVAVDDLDRDIARLEKDVEQVRARKDRDQARLDAGTGPARELEALQHELASLTRRQCELEDAELELMEQRETAQAALDEVRGRLARRPAASAADTEVAPRPAPGRDRPRTSSSGRGAAAPLVGRPAGRPARASTTRSASRRAASARRCCAPAAAAAAGWSCPAPSGPGSRRPPPDEVVRCEECRRIMVRTAESGL